MLIRLRSIGDIVLLTPALRILKGWRPDLRISVVVESRFRGLLENNPDVEEILDPGEGSGWDKIKSRIRAAQEIRRRKFSVCINLHGGPTSILLTRWSRATCKVGFHHYRSSGMYDILIPDAKLILEQSIVHTAELQAAAFFQLGLPRQVIPRARLFVSRRNLTWWEDQRATLGLAQNQEYALVQPTALFATKQWAPAQFARLGHYLEREKGLQTVYSCGPGESWVLDALEQASGSAIQRLENSSLGEFSAALAGARLFVGNDSGPAHMAQAHERPSVVIFGSSSSAIWGPWPRPKLPGSTPLDSPVSHGRIVQNFFECNPCPGDRCYRFERPECILSVTFEQVQSAVDEVLKNSRSQLVGGG